MQTCTKVPKTSTYDKQKIDADPIQSDIPRQIGTSPQQEPTQLSEEENSIPNRIQSASKSSVDIESSPLAIAELILPPPPPLSA